MRVDSNTNGHRQWFYFSMKNQKKCKIKLHIYRFKKQYSLFQRGMKPYVKSRKQGKNWRPGGENIVYHYQRQRNDYGVNKDIKNYVLTFTYAFQHQNDEVFIAAGIPYSYSFLQKQLVHFKDKADKRENLSFQISNLGKSMCGLDLHLITIEHRMARIANKQKKKRFIIINTRTHPGETSSSWVLDGFLQEIGQCSQMQSWMLAGNITFKIVPMLNPDGVFIGNYRTGIIGDDFNRKFNSGKKQFYLQIFALKRLISQCKKHGTVQLFLDLHGHSILKNSFIYGPSEDFSYHFNMRTLPYHLLHNSKYFRFASCKFNAQKENIETARIYFQLKEGILTFTSETSLGLYYSQSQTIQMLQQDYQQFGRSVLYSIMDTSIKRDVKIPQQQFKNKQRQTQKLMKIKQTEGKKAQDKLKISTPKNSTKNKINFRLPTANKTIVPIEQLEINNDNCSFFSQQVNREEDINLSNHSANEKLSKEQNPNEKRSNFRRKSEVMKVPKSNLLQRIINKNKQQIERKRKNSQDESNWFGLGRSATYDTSQTLKKQIELAKNQDQQGRQQNFEIEPINENFSEDYVSMNDLDSQGEDLPEQQKNYLFEYIKSNQQYIPGEDQLHEHRKSQKEEKMVEGDSREQKASRFREIRFKSIEEMTQCEASLTGPQSINIKKIKLQPNKFKDNVSKSLIYKYHQIVPHVELDDTNLITISQQKRLNERSQLHRTQKDPFILFQRKQKNEKCFEKQ